MPPSIARLPIMFGLVSSLNYVGTWCLAFGWRSRLSIGAGWARQ
jgi:hypothetical protein